METLYKIRPTGSEGPCKTLHRSEMKLVLGEVNSQAPVEESILRPAIVLPQEMGQGASDKDTLR